jgi:hypothetical protein
MFFKTDAPAGANLYACTATNTWSVQGGITGSNCWADASSQTLRCQDPSGNVYTVVKTATSGTANQWVDYLGANGTPHTSQPTAAAVGAVADPGTNGVPYRSGAGAATAASADQMSGPFFCQDAGTSGAYSCSLAPAIAGYTIGTTYWFRANSFNSGNATLNLNGLGPKTIVKQANQPLGGNDIRAGQWVMVTYDGANMQMQSQVGNAGGNVSAVFGRAGAVTAQTGDYAFPQIGGTASAAQLPSVAMRMDQGNAVTAGTQDFSQSAHTLPMKSGSSAAMPVTCSVGEAYFATDVAAGSNLYGCTAPNVWSAQAGSGGSSNFAIKAGGTLVGSRNTLNIIPGIGMAPMVTDTGAQINVQIPIDTAVTDTRLNAVSGADLLVTPLSNSRTTYAGCPSGLTPPLTSGMVVHLVPDVSSTGGATTLNYCGTGAIALMEADGDTNPTASELAAGRQADIWYDGTNGKWRLKAAAASGGGGGGGAVSSVFTRTGAVGAASGDYTAAQVTNAVSTAGSYSDPSWLTLSVGGGRLTGLGTAATVNTGTSGGAIPLLNASNTWGAAQSLGSSTATTQGADDNSTKLATTAYVDRMRQRAIGYNFDGGGAALTTSNAGYFTVPFACTISAWSATVDTGTITWDVWKIATGTVIPTVSNTIVASAAPVIASGTALHSATLTGWTTAVAANDIFGFKVSAVASATRASLVLECDQ